jgi:hypothetical protein
MPGGIDAAGKENFFLLIRPATEDGSPGQIDDDIMMTNGFLPLPLKVRITGQIGNAG